MSVQREKSRKYSQYWQQQHAADELKTVAAAVNYLSEHGISTLDELDAALSSVSDQADAIREGMKTAEKRMKELQKLIEYGKNYTEYKPIHDELKKLKNGWTNKRDKYEEAHRAELTLWNAANRYLHANLPKGTKTLPNLSGMGAGTGFTPIVFRPEQEEAIEKTLKQFKTGSRMLWNAKMRFGKTLSALQVVKKSGFAKTIIVSRAPQSLLIPEFINFETYYTRRLIL